MSSLRRGSPRNVVLTAKEPDWLARVGICARCATWIALKKQAISSFTPSAFCAFAAARVSFRACLAFFRAAIAQSLSDRPSTNSTMTASVPEPSPVDRPLDKPRWRVSINNLRGARRPSGSRRTVRIIWVSMSIPCIRANVSAPLSAI